MTNKGIIGYFGNNSFISKNFNLFDKLKQYVHNSILYKKENFVVLSTEQYVISENIPFIIYIATDKSRKKILYAEITIERDSIKFVRDNWGTKTIYYHLSEDGIFFSSDIRFLLALNLPKIIEYDKNSLLECSLIGYIYNIENTLFKNIKQVRPHSNLTYNIRNVITTTTTKRVRNRNKFSHIENAYDFFKRAFENAVAQTLELQENKIYLLSGGMDSSAIVLSASALGRIQTATFVSKFNKNDEYYSNSLANTLKTNHINIFFNETNAMLNIPNYLHDIENIEPDGIFTFFGGYALYLMCKELAKLDYKIVISGDGADEILGGYYWQLTHPFGFVGTLKEKTKESHLYHEIASLFPEVENREIYRQIVFDFLQGSALTNYHLNFLEHTTNALGMASYPIFMNSSLDDATKDIKIEWLCDGKETKIILRKYLQEQLTKYNLQDIIGRKKLSLPSVISETFKNSMYNISKNYFLSKKEHPFSKYLAYKPLNYFLFDVFHKYFTLNPLKVPESEEWLTDLQLVKSNECFISW